MDVEARLSQDVRGMGPGSQNYLTTSEVADLLHVSPKTVTRWAREGRLPHSRTLGGHRRYPGDAIRQLATELYRATPTPD